MGSLVPPMLNPSSLYKEEAKRDATRIRIYNSVLQQIYNKIKMVARVPGNEKTLWYVVPEFLPGVPRFDSRDAILYIVWNLRNMGYTVEYTHPNLLFITWRSHDERYHAVESPWSQVLSTAAREFSKEKEFEKIQDQEKEKEKEKALDKRAEKDKGLAPKAVLKKTSEYKPIQTISTKHVSFV